MSEGIELPKGHLLSLRLVLVEMPDNSVSLLVAFGGDTYRGDGADFNEAYFDLKSNIWKGKKA